MSHYNNVNNDSRYPMSYSNPNYTQPCDPVIHPPPPPYCASTNTNHYEIPGPTVVPPLPSSFQQLPDQTMHPPPPPYEGVNIHSVSGPTVAPPPVVWQPPRSNNTSAIVIPPGVRVIDSATANDVPDFMCLAIVGCLFCPLIGLVAIVMASNSLNLKSQGHFELAMLRARGAKNISIASIIVGIMTAVIVVTVTLGVGMSLRDLMYDSAMDDLYGPQSSTTPRYRQTLPTVAYHHYN